MHACESIDRLFAHADERTRTQRTQGRGWFGGGADLTPYYLHDQDVQARLHVIEVFVCVDLPATMKQASTLSLVCLPSSIKHYIATGLPRHVQGAVRCRGRGAGGCGRLRVVCAVQEDV